MTANICKQWTKVITIIVSSNEVLLNLFELFDLKVKGQGPTKVITVRDTPPYGHAPTYQISLTYFERKKCYGLDKKILFKKQLYDLEVKGQGPTRVITAGDTPPYCHAPTYQISLTYLERKKCYGPDKKILFKVALYKHFFFIKIVFSQFLFYYNILDT